MKEKKTDYPYHPWIAAMGGRRFLFAVFIFLTISFLLWHEKISSNLYTTITIAICGVYITGTAITKYTTAKLFRGANQAPPFDPDDSMEMEQTLSSDSTGYHTEQK